MPQTRRKTPFSGKAKKQQIQNKKQKNTLLLSESSGSSGHRIVSMNSHPNRRDNRSDRNRYALKFHRESEEELQMKKEEALKCLNPVSKEDMEIEPSEFFAEDLSFPKRPPWNFDMSPAQLEAQEQKYFAEYVSSLERSRHWSQMSYFELNIETWRQLWRVLEMSDVLLLIVDVRFAPMMFPPSLYEHVVKEQRKDMIVVMNKIDLVPSSVVAAWKHYMTTEYPGLRVVYFTSCPGYNLRGGTQDKAGLQIRRRKGRLRMCAEGATKLLEACKEIVQGQVDLTSWEEKIKEETDVEFDDDERTVIGETLIEKPDTSYYKHERYKNGVLTIGCVGQPNVGKSSLMNAIMGKKVVSVSRTPGHTKHFQTIFLTPQVRLCDCPGLVFPSRVPRTVQILMGSYPIAQLREPYTALRYIAERIDLPKLLRITHPENDCEWSPRDVCDGWAKKRGFVTAKAARLDSYRAANDILRMALDGRICLWLAPKGYHRDIEKWETHEEVKYVKWVQALSSEDAEKCESSDETDDDKADVIEGSDTDSTDDGEFAAAVCNQFDALGREEDGF